MEDNDVIDAVLAQSKHFFFDNFLKLSFILTQTFSWRMLNRCNG